MALAPGTRLGAYEIVSLLGAGGMGEVYRARDTKLGRDVALKVLPDAFTNDPERLARFRREAQVLASLNHPNIAAIYGHDESDGVRALVLELVDGPTLADRIADGRLPIDEALAIANQIVEGLEAAHEQGIIHRDLKPANIKLRPDGTVKILDFGLAKAIEPVSGVSASATTSPTITSPAMTRLGVILGTAAYMSPEQAKGRAADKRSDVWAFGCVLYEMLAGKRAFDGDDPTEVIAAVIRGEPDWKALTVDVPEHVRLLIRRCLEKDRGKRISDISTARFVILESETFSMPGIASGGSARAAWSSRRRRMTLALVAAISASAFTGAIVWQLKPAPAQLPVTRFIVQLPADQQFTNTGRKIVAISPDGTRLVYVANSRLYLKAIDRPEATAISGTEAPGVGPSGVTNLSGVTSPVFSPDGQSIAFYSAADRAVKRISTTGGTAVTLCRASNPFAMSWDGDAILFTTIQGIMRVPENGGSPEALATLGVSEQADTLELLPGGRILLYTVANRVSPDRWDKAQVVVQAIGSHERTVVIDGGSDAHYLPTGHIVYAVSGVLFAVPFNLQRLKVTGGAVSVVEGVRRSSNLLTGVAQYAVSRTGTLMFAAGVSGSGLTPGDLALVDQKGTTEPLKLEPRRYFFPRFSPDGQRIAIQIDDVKESNIWIYDLAARSPIYRLTFGGNNRFPVWTPDGSRVAFQSDREGDAAIFWQRADTPGNAERLIKPDKGQAVVPNAFSPVGEAFLYTASDGARRFLWVYSQRERKATRFDDVVSIGLPNATFSPDGKWVAYEVSSALNAGVDVFVQPFPATGEKVQIGAGRYPMWSRDERRLYYFAGVGTDFGVVDYTDRPTFKVVGKLSGWPRSGAVLMPVAPRNYDLAPDGKHFLIVVEAGGPADAPDSSRQIQVVANWFEELKARVPTK